MRNGDKNINLQLPSNNLHLPANTLQLPANNLQLPANNLQLPANNITLPNSTEQQTEQQPTRLQVGILPVPRIQLDTKSKASGFSMQCRIFDPHDTKIPAPQPFYPEIAFRSCTLKLRDSTGRLYIAFY
jgi:hypothetical protein